ncbi:MAG: hypothetical protein GY722_18995 [bacterium]|nr:hypothetical protein [bacterium]
MLRAGRRSVGRTLREHDAPLGRRTALEYPNGLATECAYDGAGRLLNIVTRNAQDEVVDGYSYTYDGFGNRLTMSDLRRGQVHSYEYDGVNRLSRWQRGSDRFEEYDYDLAGNRTELRDQAATVTYACEASPRPCGRIHARLNILCSPARQYFVSYVQLYTRCGGFPVESGLDGSGKDISGLEMLLTEH